MQHVLFFWILNNFEYSPLTAINDDKKYIFGVTIPLIDTGKYAYVRFVRINFVSEMI